MSDINDEADNRKYKEGQIFKGRGGLEWVIKKYAERGIYIMNVYHPDGRVLGIIFPEETMIDTMLNEKIFYPMIGESIEARLSPEGVEDNK